MSRPVLAYWDIRGYAQPIRLLLAYTGTDFEDKYYVTGPAPTFDKSCWYDVKHTFGFDFPNLPYFIDGDVKLTQSGTILWYIGRKHNLVGSTEEEKIRIDLAEAELNDFRNNWMMTCYLDFDKLKDEYSKNLVRKLDQFSKFLGDLQWLAGDKISIVDFLLFEALDQHLIFDPNCLDNFENLKSFVERFRSLETIKAYMSSDKYLARPLNNRMASFGSE